MPSILDPQLRRALVERMRYYNEMGIYDFYQRGPVRYESLEGPRDEIRADALSLIPTPQTELREEMPARKSAVAPPVADENIFEMVTPKPEYGVSDPVAALKLVREDLGDCTRCKLHQQGRKQIVFGVGNPSAELMFVGEGPGADEDTQGEPFVGRAGQLLNNMIKAMGLRRQDVYIANIVKCRPPGNRTPERDECETCSPFLMRQIAVIKPRVIVSLGAVSAQTLLAINAPMAELRGHWYDFRATKLAVTYHPAFLLRDPRQKKEAWKDLQMVMKALGLPVQAKAPQ